jgi:hypothetical protein
MIIILIRKNKRNFYLTETLELTWIKDFAWKFQNSEEAKICLQTNRLAQLQAGEFYEFVDFETSKNF